MAAMLEWVTQSRSAAAPSDVGTSLRCLRQCTQAHVQVQCAVVPREPPLSRRHHLCTPRELALAHVDTGPRGDQQGCTPCRPAVRPRPQHHPEAARCCHAPPVLRWARGGVLAARDAGRMTLDHDSFSLCLTLTLAPRSPTVQLQCRSSCRSTPWPCPMTRDQPPRHTAHNSAICMQLLWT